MKQTNKRVVNLVVQ